MIKRLFHIVFVLLLFITKSHAQDYAQYSRGVTPFFTSYFDSTYSKKLSGKYTESSTNFKKTTILENGIIVYQETFYVPTDPIGEQVVPINLNTPVWKKNYVFKRFSKKDQQADSLIAMMTQYGSSGNVSEKKIWFYNKTNRRCLRTEKFNEAGGITERSFHAYLSFEEANQQKKLFKEENVDYDGFVNQLVPIYAITRFYPNGIRIDETPYLFIPVYDSHNEHWRINGIQRSWRQEDGTLLREVNYKNGKLHDTSRYFFPNGNLEAIQIFENNEYIGKWLGWNENGNLIHERVFFGTSETRSFPNEKRWSDDGQLMFSREMSDSLNGIEKVFSKEGRLLSRREIKSGNRNARFEEWNESGQLLHIQTDPKFCKDTLSAKWDHSGQLTELVIQKKSQDTLKHHQQFWKSTMLIEDTYSETIRMDLLIKSKKYFENGTPKETLIRKVGPNHRYEYQKTWNENGNPIREQTLNDVELDSVFQCWYSNGQAQIIAYYTKGIRHGHYQHFDSTGKLLFRNSYTNGVAQSTAFIAKELSEQIFISESQHDSLAALARQVTINLLQTGKHPYLQNTKQLFISSAQIDSLAYPLERAFRFMHHHKIALPLAWEKSEYQFRISAAFFHLDKEEQIEILDRFQKKCIQLQLNISPNEFIYENILNTKKIKISNTELIHIGTLKMLMEKEQFFEINWQQKSSVVIISPKRESPAVEIHLAIPGNFGAQISMMVYPDGGVEFKNHILPVLHFGPFQE